MTTTELDPLTDKLAKTDSTAFPVADKLDYYNIANGLLNSLVIDEQEDTNEEEYTKDTVANQREYKHKARIHHINWLKINYGDGFIPAKYRSEESLIQEYGNNLETELSQWPQSTPVYWYKGQHFFVVPAPSSSQAGTGRLKASIETLPEDLAAGDTPSLIPANFHYLLAVYAAYMYHDINGEDAQATKRKAQFDEGARVMLDTMFPRAREAEMQASVPNDDGSDY